MNFDEPQIVNHPRLGEIRFDWRPRHDPRSLNYLIADNFSLAKQIYHSRAWTLHRQLDQGNTPGCTGWSLAQVLLSTPKIWPDLTDKTALNLYHAAQDNDEWPGNAYEGSSVLGAQQAARKLGYTKNYFWAKTLEELKHGVVHHGPMQIGSVWKSGMFSVDTTGYIHVTGSDAGGHAYEIGAYSKADDAFVIYNTWGTGWGMGGKAKVHADELASIVFSGDGEAALPIKVKFDPALVGA